MSKKFSRRLFLAAIAALVSPVKADLYDDYINSTSKQYNVDFLAREGVPGHAFVRVRINLNASLEVTFAMFGLYPENGAKAALKSVFTKSSGKIGAKFDDLEWTERYSKTISEAQFKSVAAAYKKWTSNAPAYSLLAKDGMNCNVFSGEIARLVGLKVPNGSGTLLPVAFIRALSKLNQ